MIDKEKLLESLKRSRENAERCMVVWSRRSNHHLKNQFKGRLQTLDVYIQDIENGWFDFKEDQ